MPFTSRASPMHAVGAVVGAGGEVLGEPFECGELAWRLLGLHDVEHGVAPVAQHAAQSVVAVAERVDPVDVGGVELGEAVVERSPRSRAAIRDRRRGTIRVSGSRRESCRRRCGRGRGPSRSRGRRRSRRSRLIARTRGTGAPRRPSSSRMVASRFGSNRYTMLGGRGALSTSSSGPSAVFAVICQAPFE